MSNRSKPLQVADLAATSTKAVAVVLASAPVQAYGSNTVCDTELVDVLLDGQVTQVVALDLTHLASPAGSDPQDG